MAVLRTASGSAAEASPVRRVLSSAPCRAARHQALGGADPVRPGQLEAAGGSFLGRPLGERVLVCVCVCARVSVWGSEPSPFSQASSPQCRVGADERNIHMLRPGEVMLAYRGKGKSLSRIQLFPTL